MDDDGNSLVFFFKYIVQIRFYPLPNKYFNRITRKNSRKSLCASRFIRYDYARAIYRNLRFFKKKRKKFRNFHAIVPLIYDLKIKKYYKTFFVIGKTRDILGKRNI